MRLCTDFALYEEKLLKLLVERHVGFVVSADMSPELCAVAAPDKAWSVLEQRSDLVE